MENKYNNTPSNWGKRIFFGSIILIVLAAFIFLRGVGTNTVFLFDILVGFLMIAGTFEMENLFKKMDKPIYMGMLGLFPVLSFALMIVCVALKIGFLYYILMNVGIIFLIFLGTFLFAFIAKKYSVEKMYYESEERSLPKFALKKSLNTVFVCLYPGIMLTFIFMINHFSNIIPNDLNVDAGLFGLIFLFATTMFADTSAFLCGRLIPSKKINIKRLGPGKSWSGLIGGIVGAILASLVVYLIFANVGYGEFFKASGFSLVLCLVAGLLSGCFNMVGDMMASFMKRQAGVKDFSNLIPGHGGIMDRVNGLCVNAVVVFLIMLIVF